MNAYQRILVLLLALALATATATACGDERGNGTGDKTGSDTTQTPNASKATQLKDLTSTQVTDLCKADNQKNSDFENPNNENGKTICLIESAFVLEDNGLSDAENIGYCQEMFDECLTSTTYERQENCMNPTDCTATVAEFETCTNDRIASAQKLLIPFINKTCADHATKAGMTAIADLFDTEISAPSCDRLLAKCPNLNRAFSPDDDDDDFDNL